MTFISYAQNLEDVMLARALESVENGFYVDVGAQNPVEHSVTKAFYDRGWSGLNIEPVMEWHRMLSEQRPRDVNLQVAAGNKPGRLKFYSIEGTGLSTADAAVAAKHRDGGWSVAESIVPVQTLDSILEQNRVQDIHFLKVDVEGFERQVLEGTDFSRNRPWIILVEATRPLSLEQSHEGWEPLLTGSAYHFAYFDGLNRFYVADERKDLLKYFAAPPNCFDSYVRLSEWHAHQLAAERGDLAHRFSEDARITRELLAKAQSALAVLQRRTSEVERREKELEHDLAAVRNDLLAILTSTSWRITAPLRRAGSAAKSAGRVLSRVRFLRGAGALVLKPFPKVKQRAIRFIASPQGALQADEGSQAARTQSARKFITLYERVRKVRPTEGKR